MTSHSRTRHALVAVALASLALVTGCSAETGDQSAMSNGFDSGLPSVAVESIVAPEADAVSATDQALIQTGYLSIRVDSPVESVDRAAEITAALNGRVESRHIYSDQSGDQTIVTSAHMTLRIPDTKLDEAYSQLSELGDVRTDQRDARDVTMEKVDLEARVDSLERSIQRLEALVTDAADLSDLIELEGALANRQSELDSLSAQLEVLTDQVSFSTISVEFVSISTTPDPEPESFWSALLAGLKSIGAVFSALIVAAGFALPWIILLGVIALVIILIVKRVRRRSKRQAPVSPDGYSG